MTPEGRPGGGLRGRIGTALPRLALDVIGVIFAVMVALAADEWREDHELAQRAETAHGAVVAELRANREELDRTRESVDSTIAQVTAAARDIEAGGSPSLAVNLDLPSFSDAAWRITQMTDASSRLEFDWLTRVARVYAAQALYEDVRVEIVRTLGTLGAPGPDPGITRLRNQLGIILQLHEQLIESYDAVLAREES